MQVKETQKVLAILGSPRLKGNTSFLTTQLLEKLNAEHNTIYLHDKNISGCIDCRGCKKEPFLCILKDDLNELYEKIDQADVLVFSTPIYWYTPTAQMKLFIDRLRPYYANKRLMGKKAAIILAAGSGIGDCDLTTEMYKRMFEALGLDYIGRVTSEAFDLGDSEKDDEAQKQIAVLSQKINAF